MRNAPVIKILIVEIMQELINLVMLVVRAITLIMGHIMETIICGW